MKRTEARELLMQLIFQMEAQKDYTKRTTDSFITENLFDSDQKEYFENVLENYLAHRVEVDEKIESNSKSWKISRIAKVDLAVLRLAITEMFFMENAKKEYQIPENVAISEAVNIAKKYGEEDSNKFVNGILGTLSKIN